MPFTQKILRSRSLALQTLSLSSHSLSSSECVYLSVCHYICNSFQICFSLYVCLLLYAGNLLYVGNSLCVGNSLYIRISSSMQYFPYSLVYLSIHFSVILFTCVSFYSLVCHSIHLCVFLFTCVSFYSIVCLSIHLCVFLFTCVSFYLFTYVSFSFKLVDRILKTFSSLSNARTQERLNRKRFRGQKLFLTNKCVTTTLQYLHKTHFYNCS